MEPGLHLEVRGELAVDQDGIAVHLRDPWGIGHARGRVLDLPVLIEEPIEEDQRKLLGSPG